jgi:glycerol-3-phosphate O-acyltransferase / dihydroxyacetone phosphate acyltransferase
MLHVWHEICCGKRTALSSSMTLFQYHKRNMQSFYLLGRYSHPFFNSLVDLFSTPDAVSNMPVVRRRLLEYYSLLQSTQLSNSVLSSLPLPRNLNPRHPASLPSRLRTLSVLMKDTLAIFFRLPFYLFPLIVHAPIYVMGHLGAKLVQDEEETMAQNKVVFGLLFSFMIYPMMFFFLWAFLWYTPLGAVLAATVVWLLAVYHVQIINGKSVFSLSGLHKGLCFFIRHLRTVSLIQE